MVGGSRFRRNIYEKVVILEKQNDYYSTVSIAVVGVECKREKYGDV